MMTYAIETRQYDMDLGRLLSRRLSQAGCVCGLARWENALSVTVQAGVPTERLAQALATLLCRDLPYFELALYTDTLVLTLPEKREVLTAALRQIRACQTPEEVTEGLANYLAQASQLNLEGYLRFRMGETLAFWHDAVDNAAAELALQREYGALLGALGDYVREQRPLSGSLAVCLHPDGSCTLTDDSDARIEYVDCSEEGIISLLVGMAPACLTVYDLSGGALTTLADALRQVFAGRVRIFR